MRALNRPAGSMPSGLQPGQALRARCSCGDRTPGPVKPLEALEDNKWANSWEAEPPGEAAPPHGFRRRRPARPGPAGAGPSHGRSARCLPGPDRKAWPLAFSFLLAACATIAGCLGTGRGECTRSFAELGQGVHTGAVGRIHSSTPTGSGCSTGSVRHLPLATAPVSDAEAKAAHDANVGGVTSEAANGAWVASLPAGGWLVCLDGFVGGVHSRCIFTNIPEGVVREFDGAGDDAGITFTTNDPAARTYPFH